VILLQEEILDVGMIEASVQSQKCGAVLVFVGRTRDNFEGKEVLKLEYETYEGMALKELHNIVEKIKRDWPGSLASIVHRLGTVPIGEASVVIAVSTPHRGASYEASRFAIEALKKNVPIWKKEIYQESAAWKANKSPSQTKD
jgi:molybdopterin synthase catalytic subunit